MKTKTFFKLIPLLTVMLLAALVVAPGCKKKMPPEEPPPIEEPAIEEVEEMVEDTTGNAMRELRMEMDRDIARIQIIYFAFDRSEITPTELEKVRSNAEILNKWPDWKITVEGHCDERGTNEYNLALGERRARAAQRALEAEGIADWTHQLNQLWRRTSRRPGSHGTRMGSQSPRGIPDRNRNVGIQINSILAILRQPILIP